EISEITLFNLLGRCSMRYHGRLIKMSIDPGTMIQLRQWVTCIKEVEQRNGTDSDTTNDVDDNAAPLASHNKTYKKLECQLKEEKCYNNLSMSGTSS
ncbi:Hypothetical predicted protein, partial [Paramuricea clavata]